MGVAIPQIVTSDRATGAQVIDGSLNFFQDQKPYLEFTPGSDGNRSTWTISFWALVDPATTGTYNPFTLATNDNYSWEYEGLHYASNNLYYIDYISQGSGANILWRTNAVFRDTGWYHFMVVRVDNSTFKLYVNGEEQTDLASSTNGGNQSSYWNKSGQKMFLGGAEFSSQYHCNSPGMSQFYFIDGQALEPTDFGFTDGLTNTWKPKKYTGTFTGTNTCYLPFDGNSPIGQDQSGNGNDWTPKYFGGSAGVDQATGALPILNTTQGGTQATVGVRTDANASNLFLALPLVGGVNDVSNQINSGSTTKVATNTNDSVTASSTQSNLYGGSHHWNSNTDSLLYAQQGNELVFGTGDFTIEFWFYDDNGHNGTGNRCVLFDNRRGGDAQGDPPQLVGWVDSHNEINLYYANGSEINITVPSTVGKWWHYAAVRSGGTTKLYINGVEVGSASDTTNYPNNGIALGSGTDSGYSWSGYIQDFRVYKTAKYTSNFIPASTSPDILPDTPSGVSGSSKLAKITDGAVSFDGTNDSVSIADHADFTFGSGDFTMEAFVYNKSSSYRSIVMKYGGNPASSSWFWSMYNGQNQFYYYSGGNEPAVTSGKTHYNKWVHCAVSREGNTIRIFDDGELTGTLDVSSYDTMNDSTVPLDIGTDHFDNYDMDGFISNVRIIKGTALYTSNFTPPTAPLTNVTNTKLLCCQSNSEGPQKTAVIPTVTGTATAMWPLNSDINDDSGNSNNLSETGGSTSFTSAGPNPFGLSNCANFTADGKYLSYAVDPASAWTIDGYVKFDDVNTGSNSYVLGWNGTNGSDTCMGLTKANSTFTVWGSSNLSTSVVAVAGRWYHIRMTTYGATDLALYVNGVLAGRSASSDGSPDSPITIGDMQSGRFHGKIAGVRYTPTDLGAPPLGGETTSSGVTSNSPSAGAGLVGDVAATTFSPFNSDINTVRGQETGYATLNPLTNSKWQSKTLKDGNLEFSGNTSESSGYPSAFSNLTMNREGKWYMEVYPFNSTDTSGFYFGICDYQMVNGGVTIADTYPGGPGGVAYCANGTIADNGSNTFTGQPTYTAGDVISVAYDADNGKVYFAKNGVYINGANPVTGDNPHGTGRTEEQFFVVGGYANRNMRVNFGQKPFKFPPPHGYQSLNLANVRPVKVISRPDQYVGVTTYTGDNSASKKIDDLLFSPDLVWVKDRELDFTHFLNDTVRGAGKILQSNVATAETDNSDTIAAFPSFDPNGFTVGANSNWQMNGNNEPYVAWCWRAGGSKNTFNIDNVGYSTAGDANMGIGDLNNTLYNTSRTWSSNIVTTGNSGNWHGSFPATNAFNGNMSNYAHGNGDGAVSATVTLTFSPAISCEESVTFLGGFTNTSSGTGTISINGGLPVNVTQCAAVDPAATDTTVVPFTGDISTIVINKTSGGAQGMIIFGFKVDEGLLVDSGTSLSGLTQYPSIAPTGCSVGTKQGFSIVQYVGNDTAGATVPHGLTKAPDFFVTKAKNYDNREWQVYHQALGNQQPLRLNTDQAAQAAHVSYFNNTSPTASVVTFGNGGDANQGGDTPLTYIMYAWHDVPGLQKFGSFIGNADSGGNGPFVELGFRPALVWFKATTGTQPWNVFDSERGKINPIDEGLLLNTSGVEFTGTARVDYLSNGFKVRAPNGGNPNVATTYIYCAWAEAPSVDLYGGGANAR